jgi:hypothetical protein
MDDKEKRFNGISPDFRKAIEELGDCPEDIFKMAKTDFEKAVAVEFFKNQEDRNIIKAKFDHLETLIKGLIGGTGLIGVCFVIKLALEYLAGI